jgi:hypothetical protein
MNNKQLLLTTTMAATLGSLGACSSNDEWSSDQYAEYDTAVCVDQRGLRVPDDQCDDDAYYGRSSGHGWYYINRGGKVPYYGDSVVNQRMGFTGSTIADGNKVYSRAPASTAMSRSTAVARGGFGSSGSSFGGGRS